MFGLLGAAAGGTGAASGGGMSSSNSDETSVRTDTRAANNIGGINFGADTSQAMYMVAGIAAVALIVAAVALKGR